ncbi:Nn.00g069640.m01.CDS01 [Neocucurbitaria sp. VM-36]
MPNIVPGSAIMKVLAAAVEGHTKKVLFSTRNPFFSIPNPFIPVQGRDDDGAKILRGLFEEPDPAAQKFAQPETWRNGNWAEYIRIPLENAHPLNEKLILSKEEGGLGYDIAELPQLNNQAVAYGSLRAIGLQAGETIVIAPATGEFSGAACEVASAMGGVVVAVGRNKDQLQKMITQIPHLHTFQLTGKPQQDVGLLQQFGTIDIYMDFSPMSVETPPYLKSGLAALRPHGRAVLTGYAYGDFAASYGQMIIKSLKIKSQYMYTTQDVRDMMKLVKKGLLNVGKASGGVAGKYNIDEWEKALDHAEETVGWGQQVVFKP